MNSQFVVLAVVLLCGTLSVNGSPASAYVQAKSETLLNYIIQSRDASSDPSLTMQCFNHYIPILNEIGDTFQANYQACIATANEAIEELITLGDESRVEITNVGDDVCEQYANCKANTDNLNFFDCYSNLGDQSVRQVYTASQDASEAASNYRETYHTIQVTQDKCTNETQRVYVTDTANTYEQLDSCLINGLPTDAPATDAPATDEPATDAPATDEPATDAPATDAPATDAPATDEPITEPATDAPATDAPATDEPATDDPITEPATDAPATDAPATDEPATDAPATDAPATDAPATDAAETTEPDQVEELSNRLKTLVSSFGKRFV